MRITHISPEFQYNRVNGTLSMQEKKSFFGSKLINFDDSIFIQDQNIVYYENENNEQLNLNLEKLLTPIIYNSDADKENNSYLVKNPIQSQSLDNPSWILSIDYGTIMSNYLFVKLKEYRTFEGVTNIMTYNNNVDDAIKEYIKVNLINRYEFFKVDLYISYNNLSEGGLRNQNNWDPNIQVEANYTNKFQTKTDSITSKIDVIWNQNKSSLDYSFNYYYNLYFRKI